MFTKDPLDLRVFGAVLALSASLVAANASANSFSFRHVEFMPDDQREAAAQAFAASDLAPGTPLDAALKALKSADAHCRTPGMVGEPITCTHRSFDQLPDDLGISDVSWIVRVTPAADGTVSKATVTRSTSGF